MRLIIEENREALKRYRHIRPGPQKGSVPCSSVCPGTVRTCTLRRGHPGPHVAHGMFGRVLAVWDKGVTVLDRKGSMRRPGTTVGKTGAGRTGLLATLRALRKRIVLKEHYVEAGLFLAFALAMVGFAIDWALRIMGLK